MIASLWVVASVLFVVLIALAIALIYGGYVSSSLDSFKSGPLKVVESQLQLDSVGSVSVVSVNDVSGAWWPGLGGTRMQAIITVSGADAKQQIDERAKSLGYTTGADGGWVLGGVWLSVAATPMGANVRLETNTDCAASGPCW